MKAKVSQWWNGCWGLVLVLGLPLFLNSCASHDAAAPGAVQEERSRNVPVGDSSKQRSLGAPGDNALAASPEYFRKPTPRPGYATSWGSSLASRMTYTSFRRSNDTPHGGISSIYYNDKRGIEEMTRRDYYTSTGRKRAANGLVEWGMRSGFGIMRNYHANGKRYVVGRKNARYSISVKNNSRSRLEVVLSVDGLDVVDGKPASLRKRGYIVWPEQTIEIRGWRSSENEVASFVFSPVAGSYSNLKHGETRNVGVVGLAVFTEKGIDPWSGRSADAQNRFSASPFAESPMRRAR
ncbi:MAG: hypothetical protein MK194_09330 [Roseibacillus sp.]|nr:hypothetical protein [Roseibacillus sp.]